ncbi:hypothetical protein NC652_015823 [Populus alba x Populus x berolinensis]|nr:hypothetical protein NC652_015823 [Populus alba x Populus x berolinensis]
MMEVSDALLQLEIISPPTDMVCSFCLINLYLARACFKPHTIPYIYMFFFFWESPNITSLPTRSIIAFIFYFVFTR